MAGNDMELPEIGVSSRNRFQGAGTRVSRARETFSPGTFLPRLQALINPRLYRERADTNELVEDALGEDGALARLAATSPELAAELRNQAETPMSAGQHREFRSVILGLVSEEAKHEQEVRNTVADNEAFMQAFSMMDAAIPGIRDDKRLTLEEQERKQIGVMFQQAQELALLDPAASRAIMAEVRKKADGLTANTRQYFEQVRKRAAAEDIALYSNSDNAIQMLRDAHEDLTRSLEKDKSVPEFVLQKALAAYGAAGSMQQTNLGDVGSHAVGEAIGGGVGGMTAGGWAGAGIGAVAGLAIGGSTELLKFFKDKKNVRLLADSLVAAQEQAAANYQANRSKLQERYQPIGIAFGQQQGEVYAVLDEAYQAEANKYPPARQRSPEEEQEERNETLRLALTDELNAADAEVAELQPEASANMPGAMERLAAALARQQNARDDLAIYEDDQRQAQGVGLDAIDGIDPDQAAKAIQDARARRQRRQGAAMQSQIRQGIREALRSHTR